MCYRCFWPEDQCWCGEVPRIQTNTHFVILMHPKEFKREKAGTGRLAHLSLPSSEIIMGIEFDDHGPFQRIMQDPDNHVVLLYPGQRAINLSATGDAEWIPKGRRLVVVILDATWSCARKMLKLSPCLQRLPRVMFTPSTPSRYVIKQQPFAGCLSTIESVYEVITALNRIGVESSPQPERLLALFNRMQQRQIDFARDPNRGGYRRSEYKTPAERRVFTGHSAKRRANFFRVPES